ncbi:MAG: glycosyltransferase family 9 protein [Bacteroidetes bacterium]|nr:glycosyltransferase family 9 protein [Bacteroidota bacterium]
MTVDTMRKVDRWAGVPLCLLLSPFVFLIDILRGGKRTPDLCRTLFIELSEMGSAIIVDPAMRRLRQEGKASLYFAIFSKNYASLALLKTVPNENVFMMKSEGIIQLTSEIFRFAWWCRKNGITTAVDLELFSRFTALLSLFSGARSRVGFTSLHDEGVYRGNLINKSVRYNPHVHMVVNFMSLANRALGLFDNAYATQQVTPDQLQLAKADVPEEARANVRAKLKALYPALDQQHIVLLNVNASELLPQRRWPQENFSAVAKKVLMRFPNALIVLTGSTPEREYVQKVRDMIGDERCVNSSGVFSFEELVPLYAISTLMLTNDSGPAHFAAVTPLKVFVIFGPETPALYLPMGGNAEAFYLGLPCSPCVSATNHRKTSCESRPCITGIMPAMVSERLERYLGRTIGSRPA